MQNHPIPQNVTAYEFHLIGNMTIKQFIELGVGIGLAVLFFTFPLPAFVQWPLIVISALGGAALAFMPFDGRPLDRMIIIFFRAVYSPTQYIWRKQPQIPEYFNFVAKKAEKVDELAIERQRVRKSLNEYLESLPENNQSNDQYDQRELAYMQQVGNLFNESTAIANPQTQENYDYHQSPKVRVRPMKPVANLNQGSNNFQEAAQAVSVDVPENNPVAANEQTAEQTQAVARAQTAPQPASQTRAQNTPISNIQQAQTNAELPFPKPPTQPNMLAGMVLDTQGKIVDNAIVEIKTSTGQPVSTLKTNSLGQFFTHTPLKNGSYQIVTSKSGASFAPIGLELKNELVGPIEIRQTQ